MFAKMSVNQSMQQQIINSLTSQQITAMIRSAGQANVAPLTKLVVHGKAKKVSVATTQVTTKATRPLNSWIAFRSYYSTMFTHVQQKDISGFLTYMWQTDPFKAKWSILAKAYSVIRDHEGKENAPLDGFLLLNEGFIGIVEPAAYMDLLGWSIAVDAEGQVVLRREFEVDIKTLDSKFRTTNKSVDDVVANSYQNGYIAGHTTVAAPVGSQAALTMATSAQPSSQIAGTVVHGAQTANATNNIVGSAGDDQVQQSSASTLQNDPSHDNPVTTTIAATTVFDPDNWSPATIEWLNGNAPDPAVDPPISSLVNTAFTLRGEDALMAAFDPELRSLVFDPFMGNQFNAFNMSDWVNDEDEAL